jgi:radical SAM protein with 4Fe4S-binding SPASM domain
MAKSTACGIPFQVTLELTYRCNLRCAHCYVDIKDYDELSFEDYRHVLEQLKEAGTLYLLLTGGEVLVRSDFLKIASYARSHGFFIGMITNCTLVTPSLARDIASLGLFSLGTSLYGATAATHEAVTKVPGSFRRTLEGVKNFVAAGMACAVQVVPMKNNISEIPAIKELVEGMGATLTVKFGMAPSKTGAEFPFQYEPTTQELITCGWHPDALLPLEGERPQVCKAGRGMCSVAPNGDVFPCIMFPMKLGNLRESTFNKIWRLEPCVELRYLRSMRRSDLYACTGCEKKEFCMRCTGAAYLESGRIDGPSPSACRQAQVRWRLNKSGEK